MLVKDIDWCNILHHTKINNIEELFCWNTDFKIKCFIDKMRSDWFFQHFATKFLKARFFSILYVNNVIKIREKKA